MDINKIIRDSEKSWEKAMAEQDMDETSPYYGGGLYEGGGLVISGPVMYADPRTKFYKDPETLRRIELNADCLLRDQDEYGRISYIDCNFSSPPDTGFHIHFLSVALLVMKKSGMSEFEPIIKKVMTFLERAIPGMLEGGFHTPNHRWVIACALSFLYKFFGDERLKQRAQEFFAEGLDCNEAGEWTERSNAIYNAACDISLYHCTENFGPEFDFVFDAIRRNLDMMKYMFHPEDVVVVEYSTRQDYGRKMYMQVWYAWIYWLMAAKDNNPEYMYLAEVASKHSEMGMNYLYLYYDEILKKAPAAKEISDNYTVLLNEGNLATVPKMGSSYGDPVLRHRRGKFSVTVMAGHKTFMFLQYGKARAFGIKFSLAWFGLGGADFSSLEKIGEDTYRMHMDIAGSYMQVFDHENIKQFNGNYSKMPNEERERINIARLSAEIILKISDDGVTLDLSTDKQDRILSQLVCMFDMEGNISSDNIETMPGGAILLHGGELVYENGGDVIAMNVIGEGYEHKSEVLRNDVYDFKAKNVVVNRVAPKNLHVEFKCYEK